MSCILDSSVALFSKQMAESGVHLFTRSGTPWVVLVHPGEIRQVFSNLMSNGLDAMGTGSGELRVRCFPSTREPDGVRGVRVLFSDTGCGIPDDVLPHIFEPFYTTKQSRGSGIGLWLSKDVLGKHRGSMRVRTRTSGPYRGTLFDVFLPMSV